MNCECGAELEEVNQDGMLLYRCVEYPSCDNTYSETELNERSDMPRYFFINGVAHTGKHGEWYKVADVDKHIADKDAEIERLKGINEKLNDLNGDNYEEYVVLERRNKVLEGALENTNREVFKERHGHEEWSEKDKKAWVDESIAQAEAELGGE